MKTTTALRRSLMPLFFTLLALAGSNSVNAQSPTITTFTPTSGSVGTLVTITGTNLSSPTAFTIGGVNAIIISNTGSTLVGMVMPDAVTGAVSVTTAGGTANSSSFSVTSTSFPSVQQGNKRVGTGSVGNEIRQGYSVSVSADGNTAIVGGYADNSAQGAAWVYVRNGTTWTQQGAKLVGTGAVGNAFQGLSVSISSDGNTAIVGGAWDDSQLGAVWVFIRSGNTWTQQGSKLVGTGSINTPVFQGSSVSLSADGNTAIVGGDQDNSAKGAAWVFTRSGGIWTQQGTKLVGTGIVSVAFQGGSVSLSADGNTAIVGGAFDNSHLGAIWVFTRSGSTWTQQGAKLVGTGAINGTNGAYQGYSVSLSADGNTAIVGGDGDNNFQGAAWVFTSSSILPVKLLSFTGERQGTNNLLHWATASEQNNKGFELQHSANGESFSKIAFVNTKAAHGNSTATLTYSFTDKTPLTGNNYYRLRQIDNDGKATLSNIVFIKGEMNNEMILSLFPNPTTNQFTLTAHSTNTQPISIRVSDAVGKMVYAATAHAEQPFRFGEKFANGLYLIEVRQGDEVKTVKAVKRR